MKYVSMLTAIALASLAPLYASAQQFVSASSSALPAGVSVVASGTASTSDVVVRFEVRLPEKAQYDAAGVAKSASALAALQLLVARVAPRARIVGTDVLDSLGTTGPSAAIVAPASDIRPLLAAVTHLGWKQSQATASVQPADVEALRDAAYAAAEKVARARAEAIAAASGQHIGRLINVTPSAADVLQGMPAANFAPGLVQGQTAAASAIFTFELQP